VHHISHANGQALVVLADARPATLLTLASFPVVLADARPAALLALASSTVVLEEKKIGTFELSS
jgi:hypothetical protein